MGTYQSNHYVMLPGKTCMIKIQNHVSDSISYWKIWKDDLGLQFFHSDKYDATDDNTLSKIPYPGESEEV